MSLVKRTPLPLAEIIEQVRQQILVADNDTPIYEWGDSFDIYGVPTNAPFDMGKNYLVDDPVIDNEQGEDVFPKYIAKNNLWLACSGSRVVDVISRWRRLKPANKTQRLRLRF